jgi:hypothetical protein
MGNTLASKMKRNVWFFLWGVLILQFFAAISLVFVATNEKYGIAGTRSQESRLMQFISKVEHPSEITETLRAFVTASDEAFSRLQSYLVGLGEMLLLLTVLQVILFMYIRHRSRSV